MQYDLMKDSIILIINAHFLNIVWTPPGIFWNNIVYENSGGSVSYPFGTDCNYSKWLNSIKTD